MSDSFTSKTLCVLALLLCGCARNEKYAAADYRILFDKEGCAFYVEPGVGETSFVRRMKDMDQPSCSLVTP